ncbi:MAG: prepilin-type N-terminal cleavage/methylation domain-containing protein [Rhodoferax sp.]
MQSVRPRQQGFTLVEIAIVLVIIGLLLGGVLKGQEMIENAKIKNGVNDLNGAVAAYNSYIDRFKALPGDNGPLATLTARGGNWANVTAAGNNNGVVAITQAQTFTGAGEGVAFWQALKASGLIAGNPADAGVAALPRNAFNGLLGVGTGVTPTAGAAKLSFCLSQVPGKAARAIDIQLDDGLPNGGSILATQGAVGANTAPGAAATAYSDDQVYTVCRAI